MSPGKLRLVASLVIFAAAAASLGGGTVDARKGRVVLNLTDTTWVFVGHYRLRAKKTGLDDEYALEFLVDLFKQDGQNLFTLQCLPIEEGDDEYFSGSWVQEKNKLILSFDAISHLILTDQFEAELEVSLGEPVDVFIENWEIRAKLKEDRTGMPFLDFKEKITHQVYLEGIPIRMKTRGNGTGQLNS